MVSKPNVFSEKTLVPVSLLVAIIGCVFWLASVTVKSTYLSERMDAVEIRERIRDSSVAELGNQLARIDSKVDFIYESVRRKEK